MIEYHAQCKYVYLFAVYFLSSLEQLRGEIHFRATGDLVILVLIAPHGKPEIGQHEVNLLFSPHTGLPDQNVFRLYVMVNDRDSAQEGQATDHLHEQSHDLLLGQRGQAVGQAAVALLHHQVEVVFGRDLDWGHVDYARVVVNLAQLL